MNEGAAMIAGLTGLDEAAYWADMTEPPRESRVCRYRWRPVGDEVIRGYLRRFLGRLRGSACYMIQGDSLDGYRLTARWVGASVVVEISRSAHLVDRMARYGPGVWRGLAPDELRDHFRAVLVRIAGERIAGAFRQNPDGGRFFAQGRALQALGQEACH